jgi:hypothetical protein
MAGSC